MNGVPDALSSVILPVPEIACPPPLNAIAPRVASPLRVIVFAPPPSNMAISPATAGASPPVQLAAASQSPPAGPTHACEGRLGAGLGLPTVRASPLASVPAVLTVYPGPPVTRTPCIAPS